MRLTIPMDIEPTSHVIIEYDRVGLTIVAEHFENFPSDADAEQFARDLCNDKLNFTASTWGRWFETDRRPARRA